MTRFAVLRLQGPLASFGDVAVDEIRRSDVLPGLSLLTGLLGNALGLRYTDYELLDRLQERLVVASRLDRRGEVLMDFQTAEMKKEDRAWRTGSPAVIKRESANVDAPVIRYVNYRADAMVTVALTLNQSDESPRLTDLTEALTHPARPLFLGRCACPPGGPIFRGEWIEAAGPREAVEAIPLMPGADAADHCEAEWPAVEAEIRQGFAMADVRLIDRMDVRDWRSDVHSGVRYVIRSRVVVNPPPVTGGGR